MRLQAEVGLQDAKEVRDPEGYIMIFPQRPGGSAQECDFFLKTGSCKFGQGCHFHHPLSHSVKVTTKGGHPIRPGQAVCPFYERTGETFIFQADSC